jgi:hypothetical protein
MVSFSKSGGRKLETMTPPSRAMTSRMACSGSLALMVTKVGDMIVLEGVLLWVSEDGTTVTTTFGLIAASRLDRLYLPTLIGVLLSGVLTGIQMSSDDLAESKERRSGVQTESCCTWRVSRDRRSGRNRSSSIDRVGISVSFATLGSSIISPVDRCDRKAIHAR